MKNIFYLFLFLSSNFIFGQNIILKEFKSNELGTTRTLKIYIPESYENDGTRLYPLSILFDGDYLFDVYTGNAKLFAIKDKAPEQIIVGILQNNERYVDCAYDKINGLPTKESDKFYRFVRLELLEYLELNYRLSPFRTLVGSTLTANFLNYFVVENAPVFDAYININPYYNTDMPVFLQNKLSLTRGQKVYYYLNSGSYNSNKKHKRIEEVAYMIKSLDNVDVVSRYDNFKNSTKISSIGQAIPNALAHIFDIYSAISQEEFSLNIKHLTPPDAIAYLENKYVEIEYLFGTNMKIRERDVHAVESIIIDQDNGDYLSSFGDMLNKLYPESPMSDYYTGMFYEKIGRYKQALKNYKNGYAKIDENSEDAEAYYQNIERVIDRQDEIIEQEVFEEEQKEAEKELVKLEREKEKLEKEIQKEQWEENKKKEQEQEKMMKETEKEQWEENKIKEKEAYEASKKLKKEEWEKRKKAEEEMREKFRKKED